MGSVRIELNGDGIRALLKSDEVQAMLMDKAEAVAQAVESLGITVGSTDGTTGEEPLPVEVVAGKGSRARANVVVNHPAALAVESKHRALGSSLDAAR